PCLFRRIDENGPCRVQRNLCSAGTIHAIPLYDPGAAAWDLACRLHRPGRCAMAERRLESVGICIVFTQRYPVIYLRGWIRYILRWNLVEDMPYDHSNEIKFHCKYWRHEYDSSGRKGE